MQVDVIDLHSMKHFFDGSRHMIIEAGRPLSRKASNPKKGVRQVRFIHERMLLHHRYHLLSQVGKGGFGVIYRAADTQFGNRPVAIKTLSSHRYTSPQQFAAAIEAFKREAFVLAHLVHPNLPRVYDFFCENGCWYLVMDFIEGETLEAYLYRMDGRLPLEHVLQIGIRLCNVLGFLHARSSPIIYRDLKPANIMLTSEGFLYLIDFGIARFFKPGQAQDTAAFGTPGYTAPEQYGRGQTTPGADIYSLGATLHHLLTGQNPSEVPFHFAPLHLAQQPSGAELGRLIEQMLDMDANRRPANMQVIKRQLQHIAARQRRQLHAASRADIAYSKRPFLVAKRKTLTLKECILLFLSGSAFVGITTSLLWTLGSIPQ